MRSSTYDNLRITEARVLAEYMVNTNVLLERGNAGFATYMRRKEWRSNPAIARVAARFTQPYVLFHSWLPGLIDLSPLQASVVADLLIDGGAVAADPLHAAMAGSLERIGWLDDVAVDVDQVARTTATVFLAMQNLVELRRFLRCAVARRPSIVVEIGTARGGMLYALTQIAARCSVVVSIDLPGGGNGGGQTDHERELFGSFARRDQQVHCLLGRSADPATVDALEEIVDGRPIDLLFVDGDHTYEGVRTDLARYGPMVAPDGIIAVHDICLLPDEWGPWTGVGSFWHELQHASGGSLLEIVDPSGVATRERRGAPWAWGIGVLTGRQYAATR